MSAEPILHSLRSIDPAHAEGAQKEILDRAVKQVGFLSSMYANMANAPAVLSTYLHGCALFRSESGLKPPEQEVVFLAVSQVNGCTYCTAAHSMLADKKSGVSADVLQAIRAGKPIPDARLAALYALTAEMVRTQGRPTAATVKNVLAAGFEEKHLLYVVLAIAVKTLSNYSNHGHRHTGGRCVLGLQGRLTRRTAPTCAAAARDARERTRRIRAGHGLHRR